MALIATGPLAQGCIRHPRRRHQPLHVYREKSTAASGDLSLHAHLLSDTIRLGEPFLVRATLTNVSRELQYIPVDPGKLMMHYDLLSFILRDSGQQFTNYPNFGILMGAAPEEAFPVPPSESIYLQRLVLSQRFMDARKSRRLYPRPGFYRLIVRFWAERYDSTGRFLPPVVLSDSLPVVVIQDSGFVAVLGSLKNRLDSVVCQLGGLSYWANDSVLSQLKLLLAGSNGRYPEEAFLVPHVLGEIQGDRTAHAIPEARDFIERYPASALTEEMSFELLDFLYPSHDTLARDSLARELATRYPRNAHAVTSKVGHQVWVTTDRFVALKGTHR